jgi:hypothetical protein
LEYASDLVLTERGMDHELGDGARFPLGLAPAREDHGDGNRGRLSPQSPGKRHRQPSPVGLDDEELGSREHRLIDQRRRGGEASHLAAVAGADIFDERAASGPDLNQRDQVRLGRLRG